MKSFSRVANCYFLCICVLQTFQSISITHGKPTTAAPLMFILMVAAIKEANEDIARHKADHEENTTVTHVVGSDGQYHEEPIDRSWKDVKVGDIIEVRNREPIPADLVLLETSQPEGQAQIMTANLDGETNLKTMTANKDMMPPGGRSDKHCMNGYGGGESGRGAKDGRLEGSDSSIPPITIIDNPSRAHFAHAPKPKTLFAIRFAHRRGNV